MGDFVIYQTKKVDEKGQQALLDTLAAQGSKNPKIIKDDSYNILLFEKNTAPIENHFQNRQGDFCASSGCFFYKGKHGKKALKAFLDDFDPDSYSPFGFMGVFTLIVKKGSRLFMVTDPMGASRVFHNVTMTLWSSSFLTVGENTPGLTPNPQGIYEYAFQETNYGEDTPFHEIKMADSFSFYEFEPLGIRKLPKNLPVSFDVTYQPYHDLIDEHAVLLQDQMKNVVSSYGPKIATALSGGYDSRLMLSLALKCGVKPKVYVYGSDTSADVTVAKKIAAGEKFKLNHINKAKHSKPDPDHYAEIVKNTFYALDGYPNEGIFDFGANVETRRERSKRGTLVLNGGGGEIYRNFFYLPDGNYTVDNLLDIFYSRFTLDITTDRFSEYIYRDNLKRKIKKALCLNSDEMSRTQMEYAYPAFRLRYWTSKDNSNNNRIGSFLTPFICYETIQAALKIPLEYKTHGRFQGDLINHIHPHLAAYKSDYGYPFNEPVPYFKKLKNNMTIYRPIWLRRNSYAIQHKMRKLQKPETIGDKYLPKILPVGTPHMAQFFNMSEIKDAAMGGRILTLEYLFKHLGV